MYGQCFSCGENGVLYNSEQRCDVCCFCGVVNDGSPLAELNAGVSDAAGPVPHSETKFKFGRNGTRQGISTYAANSKSGLSKNAVHGQECLERLMSSYGLSSATQQQACKLYLDNFKKRNHYREVKALAGAVFMVVMRMEKRAVSFKEVAEMCESPVKIVGRQFKVVQKDLLSKGQHVVQQPSCSETVHNTIELYASKLPRTAPLRKADVVQKSLEFVEWIDACTLLNQWPPNLFALSVFFLSFKAVNAATYFQLDLKQFNKTYALCNEKVLQIPTFHKVSPKVIVQEVIDVVNLRGGAALGVTHDNFYFLFDTILKMKPLVEFKVSIGERSTENDAAFERFQEEKRAQELRELQAGNEEQDCLSVIDDSEINEYILSNTEVQMKQRLMDDASKSKA